MVILDGEKRMGKMGSDVDMHCLFALCRDIGNPISFSCFTSVFAVLGTFFGGSSVGGQTFLEAEAPQKTLRSHFAVVDLGRTDRADLVVDRPTGGGVGRICG